MIFEEELKLGRKIGSGAEGEVFLARWKGIQVAAKEFIVRGGKHGEKEARVSGRAPGRGGGGGRSRRLPHSAACLQPYGL
jgi:hypothetical protein